MAARRTAQGRSSKHPLSIEAVFSDYTNSRTVSLRAVSPIRRGFDSPLAKDSPRLIFDEYGGVNSSTTASLSAGAVECRMESCRLRSSLRL
jgi:hypothetical protein